MSARATKTRLRTLDMTYIALFAVLMAVCAWISIPAPVPFTLQTFAVSFTLLALGGRRGSFAILTYLLMGAVGLPVFNGFRGGLGVLLGTSEGYILGFAVMAVVFRAVTAVFVSRGACWVLWGAIPSARPGLWPSMRGKAALWGWVRPWGCAWCPFSCRRGLSWYWQFPFLKD